MMHWVPAVLAGVVVSLLMAAVLSRKWWRPRTRGEALRPVDARRRAAAIVDLSLVALVVILLVLLADYYFW
jgi:hypothetical protein